MPKITAIYGGGFKPPQKGHFKVVEETLSLLPDIDEFKIYVGGGTRDGITQEDSIKVWNIYKKYLPDKIKIESSVSPIGDIMRYAKDHPDEKIYFVLGAREGKEEDYKDIESRTKGIKEKYPNIEVKIIFSTDPEISGTNARKALSYYKEFFKYLPENLSMEDKEQIYNILKSKNLEENDIVNEYENQETLNPVVFDGFEIKPDIREKLIKIGKFFWNEMELPYPYEDIILLGSSANYNWTPYSDIDLHILVDYSKFPNPELLKKYFSEVKSNWNQNHQLKINDNYIELYVQGIDEPNAAEGIYSLLQDKWIKQPTYQKIFIPDSEINKKADPFKKEIDDLLSNPSLNKMVNLQKRIKNFRKVGLENEGEYSIENLAFKELRNSGYIEKLIKARNELTDSELLKEKNKLNENATYSNFIDYKQQIKDLTKYYLTKYPNIEQLPKVIFKHKDSENAKNFFGKTAYYDPNTMTIVLYTEGRHPKDIVRSFSHEMIHHIQNIEGRLHNISTTNTTEDSDLQNLEKEAYLDGNISFRNWTDLIQEKKQKDYFGLNQFARELAQGLEEIKSSPYQIYVDMDGVLCDFDSRVEEFFNKNPKEYSRDELVEAVNSKGVEFWSKMKWIEGGRELWSMVSKYNPSLLTSPGMFKYAPEGKKIWVKENLSPQPQDIIFQQARNKHLVLSGKDPKEVKKSILIDDYNPNVKPWKEEGGIGILHKSFDNTQKILNKFGII